jgi:coenzyme Q-binding protein COQ10
MSHIRVEKKVQLSADQAFAIAADVASYKEFVPLVKRSTIRGSDKTEGDIRRFSADLLVSVDRLKINESFTSTVVIDASAKTVTATSEQGPIKSLKAVWTITELESNQCNVSVEIDYQFKSMLLQMAAGGFVNIGAQRVLEAFELRGKEIYAEATS